MNKDIDDYFHILEVHILARNDVIKASYKKLCQLYHPDNGGDPLHFQKIQDAYQVLIHPDKRKAYLRKWQEIYLSQKPYGKHSMTQTVYDYVFSPLKSLVNEYMFFLMNNEYEMAYSMISNHDKKKIFKKDFILWQKLIGQVHQLIEFDCIIESFHNDIPINNYNNATNQVVSFKVRVLEMNMILNHVEEDYFTRNLIYENGEWKILINDINIEKVIRKYKKIIALNKKNKKVYQKELSIFNEKYSSKGVSISTFIDKCEYEHLRFKRYNRTYTVLKIEIIGIHIDAINEIYNERALEEKTRNLDAYCKYQPNIYLILLPETNIESCKIVEHKLKMVLETTNQQNKNIQVKTSYREADKKYQGVKAILEQLINIE